ncbi:MAG: FAD-dependent oxidoreductase [Solirubrobacteraceae bacterium]|nr:FAD-dependent oxidoreductase [Solirubrobacteraceae bacterium]
MRISADGWWIEEAGSSPALFPLEGAAQADVAIVGAGYTGLWCAWRILELDPGCRVVLLDRQRAGHGPSGRNGGFCKGVWMNLPALVAEFGDDGALAVARACDDAVTAIEAWCRDEGVDAWFRRGGYLSVSTHAAHDTVHVDAVAHARRLGVPDRIVSLTENQTRSRFGAPTARGGVFDPSGATLHPARLARALRDRLLDQGVSLHEHSPVVAVHEHSDGVRLETPGGSVEAQRVVLAAGPRLAAFGPLHGKLTVASSHAIVTEPVPDVLAEYGWTGGEAIIDRRTLLHYLRTTPDGRIVFGWGGGRPAMGARIHGAINGDPAAAARAAAHLAELLPAVRGRTVEQGWGGPIDISPTTLPALVPVGPRVDAAFGYTGRGVGPTRLLGELLAARALGHADDRTRLPIVGTPRGTVPPEPVRWVGATAVRAALVANDERDAAGRRPGALPRFVAGLPARLGITVGR